MNESIPKISWGQMLIVLLICRIFTLMTYVPLISDGYNFQIQLVAAIISTIIQAIIIIPLVLFNKVSPNESVTSAIINKNKILGYCAGILYLIFFMTYAVSALLHFMRFLNDRFFPETDHALMLFILIAVCAYCAYCGIEGLSRSSFIVLIFFIIMLIVMAVSSAQSFDTVNFYSYDNKGLFAAVTEDLARNSEIVAAAFLIKNVKNRCKCSLYGLLAAKLILSEIITALIIGVLGDFSKYTDYPFMTIGSYSGAGFFQRNDAIYLILWTVTAVISIALFIALSGELLKEFFPEIKLQNSIISAVIFAAALFFTYTDMDITSLRGYICGAVSLIILAGIIPLCLWLSTKGSVKNEK